MAGTVGGAARNRLITPQEITNEALWRLKHHLQIPRLASHTVQKYFADKIGDTITIKKPYKAKVNKGVTIPAANNGLWDETVEFEISNRYNFALDYTDEDRTLRISAFGERYLKTGAEELAYKYDEDGGAALGAIYTHTGTAGTQLGSAELHNITAHAAEIAIPKNSRNYALVRPAEIANLSEDIKSVNVPDMVGGAIRRFYSGEMSGWQIFQTINVPNVEVKRKIGTPLANSASAQRGETIATDGWGNAAALSIGVGSLITFAGVYEIKPRGNRERFGRLKTFRVTEAPTNANASGEASIKIDPPLDDGLLARTDGAGSTNITLGDAYKNASAAIADNAAINVVGQHDTKDQTYERAMFYEQDCLMYASIQLVPPNSARVKGTQSDPETGLAIMYLQDFDVKTVKETTRLDIYYGVKVVYPEVGMQHYTRVV